MLENLTQDIKSIRGTLYRDSNAVCYSLFQDDGLQSILKGVSSCCTAFDGEWYFLPKYLGKMNYKGLWCPDADSM